VKRLLVVLLASILALSGCTGAVNSQLNQCQVLADKYLAEYQAYVDARAANGGVETSEVMEHYYASGDYYLQFMDLGCEEQGYSLG